LLVFPLFVQFLPKNNKVRFLDSHYIKSQNHSLIQGQLLS